MYTRPPNFSYHVYQDSDADFDKWADAICQEHASTKTEIAPTQETRPAPTQETETEKEDETVDPISTEAFAIQPAPVPLAAQSVEDQQPTGIDELMKAVIDDLN